MQTYRLPDCKLWLVVVTEGNEIRLEPEYPVIWPEACCEVERHLREGADDVMLVSAGPARPWSERTLTAYLDVLDHTQGPVQQEDLLEALTVCNLALSARLHTAVPTAGGAA